MTDIQPTIIFFNINEPAAQQDAPILCNALQEYGFQIQQCTFLEDAEHIDMTNVAMIIGWNLDPYDETVFDRMLENTGTHPLLIGYDETDYKSVLTILGIKEPLLPQTRPVAQDTALTA